MSRSVRSVAPAAALLATVACVSSLAQGPAGLSPITVPVVPIHLEQAKPIEIPTSQKPLEPKPIKLEGRIQGWAVAIPGRNNIATPAYSNGRLFVGGGYGSYDFYAFDAATGRLAWKYHTKDDGPTAAVVEDGCVAFNTESCTVYVLDEKTGKCLWSEWLGDPLMSQPAIAKGNLFMAYPSGGRGKGSMGHALLCADLRTGKHIWNKSISSDVISAPIIEDGKVYVTCMNGDSFCFDAGNGSQIWKRTGSYTSAPLVYNGKVIVAEKQVVKGETQEGVRRIDAARGDRLDEFTAVKGKAPYLMQGATNGTIGPQKADLGVQFAMMDSSVGFGGGAPAAANLSSAYSNMGIKSVAGAWGYQGARAAYKAGAVSNSQLTNVTCVDANSGKLRWKAEAKGTFVTGKTQVFSPPSLGKDNMYLTSGDGHVVCLDQKNGAVKFMYHTKQPISFQPALANGNVYFGTASGELVCLETGNKDADNWTAWGGNAQHNKKE